MKYLLVIFISSTIFLSCKKNETNPDDLITWKVYTKYRPGDSTFTFYIPSGFTPNWDGTNDYWEPKSNFLDSSRYHIDILDKSGKVIFDSNAPAKFSGKGKDGKILGEQTFCYYIESKDKLGESYTFKGQFVLIR